MEYQLEICRPGSSDSDAVIKVFSAAVAFLPLRVGELLNTKTWGMNAEWPLLRVVNVEHLISENTSAGIDPAGRITHRVLLYTESVPDTAEARRKTPVTG
jgi:hypothetical protein